jgi:Fe-S cluster biogenesis protein NfuA/nitrite reductase/ring-hydroxylating ferredoxin subunit
MATVERPPETVEEDVSGRVSELMEFWGEGLARILATVDDGTRARLTEDEVVAGLMLMHGLHPVDLETRVSRALDSVRPYLESHGGDVELLGVADGVARLRLEGSCHGCAASRSTLELAIESALEEAAPDLLGLDVEGVAPERPRRNDAPPDTEWVVLDEAAGLERGATTPARGLMVANVAGTLLAYQDRCARCLAPLSLGTLAGGRLTCATCDTTFDLPRAGRAVDDATLQLEPVPLLRNGGPVRVALPVTDAGAEPGTATCELCPIGLGENHRHLLHLTERRIVCVCETCWSVHSGDPEYRPPGMRTLVLDDFRMSDDVWAAFQIPIGLTFLLRSSVTGTVVALYPSPAGATESELELTAWDALCEANPILDRLEPDAEALIVDRTGDRHRYAIVPIDRCYQLVGSIKAGWEGITGGPGVERAVAGFFEAL